MFAGIFFRGPRARSRWLCLLGLVVSAPTSSLAQLPSGADRSLPPAASPRARLTTARAIRELDREAAAQRLPVTVRGVVTFCYTRSATGFVLENEGTGIWVGGFGNELADGSHAWAAQSPAEEARLRADFERIETGMVVEVEGHAVPGGYAPAIAATTLQVLGREVLPPAPVLDASRLLTGALDCQRVQVQGVVQQAGYPPKTSRAVTLVLAIPGHRIPFRVVDGSAFQVGELVGARVAATAVALSYFNERAEIVGAFLASSDFSAWQIVEPPARDPFAVPEVTLPHLRPFTAGPPILTRQRLSGRVTLSRPGEFLIVEGDQRAVRVNTADPHSFAPGDIVEASGFVELRQNFAELMEAAVRKVGVSPPPEPVRLGIGDVLAKMDTTKTTPQSDYQGRLITLEGQLRGIETQDGARCLLCAAGETPFRALLARSAPADALGDLRAGSRLRVTGVCDLQYNAAWPTSQFASPIAVDLLLRSPADVAVLQAGSWWTPARLRLALLATLGILVASLTWIFALRRLVQQRSARLEDVMRTHRDSELEFAAVQHERQRLAADMHDGLQQLIAGATYRLEAAAVHLADIPPAVQTEFSAVRSALVRAQNSLRDSLSGLHLVEEGSGDFAALLAHAASTMDHWPSDAVEVRVEGEPFPLSRHVMGSLLLLMQEAVGNAFKHGQARHVRVALGYDAETLELRLEDDGQGFDPATAPGTRQGHFGLESMRHRMRWLGGSVEIASRPGEGARVCIRLPRSRAQAGENAAPAELLTAAEEP